MTIHTTALAGDSFMPDLHHGSWALQLPRQQVRRLDASGELRALRVLQGRVWASGGCSGLPAADHVLEAGELLPLRPGTEWLLQGWPQASVSVLIDACAALAPRRPSLRQRWRRWLRPPPVLAPAAPCA